MSQYNQNIIIPTQNTDPDLDDENENEIEEEDEEVEKKRKLVSFPIRDGTV